MTAKPFSPSSERNRDPILDVIRHEFRDCDSVLEIGSGTGQHAVYFGAALAPMLWQTSDRDENHAAIQAWLSDSPLTNVLPPLALDVVSDEWPSRKYGGIFSANTAHIMSFLTVERMFDLTAATLDSGGVFCLYGPFRQDGKFNAASNAEFDRSLRERDPQMGIRDLEDMDRLGIDRLLHRERLYALPANNHLAVWVKQSSGEPA